MRLLVLDASVAVGSCLGEPEARQMADAVLDVLLTGRAVVPGIWLGEVANALVGKERTGRREHRLESAEVGRYLGYLSRLPVGVRWGTRRSTFGSVAALARRTGLTVYDSHYVELAQRLGIPLCSLDQDLCDAASAVGVTVLDASTLADWNRQ
jgi:predicted nucleic acid-binding protein